MKIIIIDSDKEPMYVNIEHVVLKNYEQVIDLVKVIQNIENPNRDFIAQSGNKPDLRIHLNVNDVEYREMINDMKSKRI